MKTIALILFLGIATVNVQAQNFLISFAGTGEGRSVDSVKVENLSQCTSLSMPGSDILNLSGTVGINEQVNDEEDQVSIFPNPFSGHCSLLFESARSSKVIIELYELSGKRILQQKENLPQGRHAFQLSGIPAGSYGLKVESGHYRYSARLISIAASSGRPEIRIAASDYYPLKQEAVPGNGEIKNLKDSKSVIAMQFNAGDTLKLTGRSGNCRTVSMFFPIQSQTVTFHFVRCSDADSNHYAVVQIGSQLWMQENLKATRNRDGSAIPNVADSAAWGTLTSGAYCDYHNNPAEGAYYGHLYNFYAIADSRNMCPVGWHVASHAEWNILEKFLDPTVDTSALAGTGNSIGRILKEGCSTRWQYYDSTYGYNSAGFTALCTNYRVSSGAWSLAPGNNHDCSFWTSTSYTATAAWYRSLRWCTCDIYVLFPPKRAGQSVRCIKD